MTVVLVDTSDAMPPIGREELTTQLVDLAEGLPKLSLLELRVMDPGIASGAVKFHACNPGDGADIDPLTGNPELAKKRWREFQDKLKAVLTQGLSDIPSEQSPIMKTIQAIAVEDFTTSRVENIAKTLVVVSDMLENGPDYSQYRGDLSFARFKKSAAYRDFRTDLHGTSVFIKYVQRQRPPIDSVAHIAFWKQWIEDNNGQFVSAEKLQGVN
ncbi:hypothetical protein ACMDCR_10195 [Labrys okinawensis]|uniref:hypothetical protein n=1 Tax=Labrys okinawensis TaxID=346911 RepID=UPI0039BD7673